MIATASYVPWLLAYSVAFYGRIRWSILGLMLIPAFTFFLSSRREREYWNLGRTDRQRVLIAVREGRPSGELRIDDIARKRLLLRARSVRSDRIAFLTIALLTMAAAVVAAVRAGPWWLLTAIPPVWVLVMSLMLYRSDPRAHLARFEATLAITDSEQSTSDG